MELKDQLSAFQAELKTYFEKAAEEKKTYGTMLEATKTQIEKLQLQVDAIDVKLAGRIAGDGEVVHNVLDAFKEQDDIQRLMRNKKGHAVINLTGKDAAQLLGREQKTTITSTAVGVATSGVLTIDRIPGITPEARQTLRVRDLLVARPTQMQVVDFVKVNAPMVVASPQVEASDKAENAVTFTTKSERVRTLATWVPATKQILDDFTELMAFLNGSLRYYVDLEEEKQILSGDGTAENLDGLITQATAFTSSLLPLSPGWTRIDVVGRAIEQINNAKELDPTFVVLNTADWWSLRLTKDSFGRYLLGDPGTMGAVNFYNNAPAPPSLFGLSVVPTTSITSGTFLVGSGNPVACEIRDRMELQIEISTEHSDYFVKNLVAVRAEKRLALIVKRPASYITGTFSTSP